MSLLLVVALLIILSLVILMAVELVDQHKHPYRRREHNRTREGSR